MCNLKNSNNIDARGVILILIASVFIMATRRPELFSNPQLWAEDGRAFLQSVWNNGVINSLTSPQDGYFQTLPKLTMFFASLFGIENIAKVSLAVSVFIRLAFISYILSSRLGYINKNLRIAFAFYISLQPNIQEVFINITNTHTYLAIYLLSIIISNEAETKYWKAHDIFILIMSGLSGPFIALLAPSLAIKRIHQHSGIINAMKKISLFDFFFLICFCVQFAAVLTAGFNRTPASLGASVGLFFDIFSYKILFGSFVDLNHLRWLEGFHYLNALTSIITISIFIYLFLKLDWRFKCASVYVLICIFVSLYKPVIAPDRDQWPLFFIPIVGCRYFVVSGMAIFCLYLIVAHRVYMSGKFKPYVLSAPILVLLGISYFIPKLDDVGFKDDLNKYKNSRSGETVKIKINPPGWEVNLIKK